MRLLGGPNAGNPDQCVIQLCETRALNRIRLVVNARTVKVPFRRERSHQEATLSAHMRHGLSAVFAIALAACASGSSQTERQARVMPDVQLAEVVGSQDTQMSGPFDVRYAVQVTNPAAQPITLRRIDVRQIGGGAYRLVRNLPVVVNTTIAPGETAQVAFWLHAYTTVMPGEMGSNEPVSLRVITFFESPTGSFQKITQALLGQF
jgi:hypothetical protein